MSQCSDSVSRQRTLTLPQLVLPMILALHHATHTQALHARQFLHTLLSSQVRRAVALLHDEVRAFAAACAAAAAQQRPVLDAVVATLRSAIFELWPAASVLLYGSLASGLMTVDSDIDLVVCLQRAAGGSSSCGTGGAGADSSATPLSPPLHVPSPPGAATSVPHQHTQHGAFAANPAVAAVIASSQHRRTPSGEQRGHVRGNGQGGGGSGSGWGAAVNSSNSALSPCSRLHTLAEHLRQIMPELVVHTGEYAVLVGN
jgi:Nucleotidyltransferase domain